jgi:hypothetical protein
LVVSHPFARAPHGHQVVAEAPELLEALALKLRTWQRIGEGQLIELLPGEPPVSKCTIARSGFTGDSAQGRRPTLAPRIVAYRTLVSDNRARHVGAVRTGSQGPSAWQRPVGTKSLVSYATLAATDLLAEGIVARMLAGISTRRYTAVALGPVGSTVERAASSTSKSAVSRRFVAANAERLAELHSRPLDGQRWLVVYLDGFGFADHTLVGALGVAVDGTKIPLGVVEGGAGRQPSKAWITSPGSRLRIRFAVMSRWPCTAFTGAAVGRGERVGQRVVRRYITLEVSSSSLAVRTGTSPPPHGGRVPGPSVLRDHRYREKRGGREPHRSCPRSR